MGLRAANQCINKQQGYIVQHKEIQSCFIVNLGRALEKEMATHSSVLAWRIPETAEPGRLPSTGSHRVGHN